jgi:hypothetical protein
MLDKLTLESFTPHVGSTFEIQVSDKENLKLELVEASAMGAEPKEGRQAFSCLFRGPKALLPQQMYPLKHKEMGEMQLFLVPVAHDEEKGETLYEAVFT